MDYETVAKTAGELGYPIATGIVFVLFFLGFLAWIIRKMFMYFEKEQKEHREDMDKWNKQVAESMDKMVNKMSVGFDNRNEWSKRRDESFTEFKQRITLQIEHFKNDVKTNKRDHTEMLTILEVYKKKIDSIERGVARINDVNETIESLAAKIEKMQK